MNTLLINLLSITPLMANVGDFEDIITSILIFGGFCCALPIVAIINEAKEKKHKIDKQTEILHEAIKMGGTENVNASEIIEAFNGKKKTLKLTIINNLKSGLICSLIGICLILVSCFAITEHDLKNIMCIGGGVLLAVGIAFIVIFFISKSYLAKEIEAEERKLNEN